MYVKKVRCISSIATKNSFNTNYYKVVKNTQRRSGMIRVKLDLLTFLYLIFLILSAFFEILSFTFQKKKKKIS